MGSQAQLTQKREKHIRYYSQICIYRVLVSMLSLATLTDQPNLEASRYAEELKSMNENQEQSANYEFTRLELCEEEFMNLAFMHPSHAWEEPFLKGLCLKPLARVVEHVKRRAQLAKQPKYYGQHYDHSSDTQATTIFEDAHVIAKTNDDTSWFEKTQANQRKFQSTFHASDMDSQFK